MLKFNATLTPEQKAIVEFIQTDNVEGLKLGRKVAVEIWP